ncbi:MAG: ATP-dependent RNA helicase SrmB [Moritella sp.]|uniref:ATP-dependent RNA helicase SrmB n=1 Tax=Moritella sp. TaxID=78556 RepID=UPI0025F72B88|nr:ATP-dependent RNA helicase SrmB [Moritella sp.]NQZ93058.1 ATP-dependent RNA helicase SrmB [Moritella sp.]
MDFESLDLDHQLIVALTDNNLVQPTLIQQQVLPTAMEGRDILASAPTGTGKTLAFLLPAIQHLLDFPRRELGPGRVLILTPTRELASQVFQQAKMLAAYTDHKVSMVTGGVDYALHAEVLKNNLDIVIATPGRLLEYIRRDAFECAAIEVLILDEADRMLDMGFYDDVKRITNEMTRRQQTMLFSATLEGRGIDRFAEELLKEPVEFTANPSRREKAKIHQFMHHVDNHAHKQALLVHWLRDESTTRSIVFVKTRERLAELVSYLQSQDIPCAYLRGEMDQAKRTRSLNQFKNDKVKVLIATDVAARGIDVQDVSHVFNFDLPRSAEIYVHRIGRTARAGKKGTAISLVEAHDLRIFGKIERYTEETIKRRVIQDLKPKNKIAASKTKKKAKVTATGKNKASAKAKLKAKKRTKKNKSKSK